MRKARSIFWVATAIILLGFPVWAGEEERGKGPDPDKQLERLAERLHLTKEQQQKIGPILEQKVQTLQDLDQRLRTYHKEIAEQKKSARETTKAQIEAELTPEQLQLYRDFREQKKEENVSDKRGKGKRQKRKHHRGESEDDDDHQKEKPE